MKKMMTKKAMPKAKIGGKYKKGGIKKYNTGGPVYEAPSQTTPTKSTTPNKFNTPVGTDTFVKSGGAIKSSYKKGGSTKSKFGLLSVIAGIDNNPKPTAADRIAGAKKRAGKKK